MPAPIVRRSGLYRNLPGDAGAVVIAQAVGESEDEGVLAFGHLEGDLGVQRLVRVHISIGWPVDVGIGGRFAGTMPTGVGQIELENAHQGERFARDVFERQADFQIGIARVGSEKAAGGFFNARHRSNPIAASLNGRVDAMQAVARRGGRWQGYDRRDSIGSGGALRGWRGTRSVFVREEYQGAACHYYQREEGQGND